MLESGRGRESNEHRRWYAGVVPCAVLGASLLLGGCQLAYYGQAVKGHLSLMSQREPVAKVIADEATPEPVRHRLRLSARVLDYAAAEMGLPAERVYRDYVALEADAVVWNVLAAPRLSLTPYTWCYWFLGCFAYRGYFDPQAARDEARRLADEGNDTYISGAVAYSTLGWFADPLTTPMIDTSDAGLVERMLHELTHRKLYIRDDTRFNESLATMVAREGTLRYLAHHDLGIDPRHWLQRDAGRAAFLALVDDTRQALARLYASDGSESDKLRAKAALIRNSRARYAEQAVRIPGLMAYRAFFNGPLNNAQLNGVQDYYGLVPAFQRLLLDCGGEWHCFWARVKTLANDDSARQAWIASGLQA